MAICDLLIERPSKTIHNGCRGYGTESVCLSVGLCVCR